jgi:hypothetical protein
MFTLKFASIKPACLLPIALLGLTLNAQTPDAPNAVPIAQEPRHHLVLENSYVRVFRVSFPGHDSTLLHQHALPYVSVSLGPADFMNAVAGKPEAHAALTDGQVGYSRGGFAHIVRTDAGGPFNNLTIELLHPQGDPRNLCQKITDGPLNDCPPGNVDTPPPGSPMKTLAEAMQQKRLFETGEILVTSFSIAIKENYTESGPRPARLLVVEQDSDLRVDLPHKPPKTLHGGEVLWLESGKQWTITTSGNHKVTRFLLITFKDSDMANNP